MGVSSQSIHSPQGRKERILKLLRPVKSTNLIHSRRQNYFIFPTPIVSTSFLPNDGVRPSSSSPLTPNPVPTPPPPPPLGNLTHIASKPYVPQTDAFTFSVCSSIHYIYRLDPLDWPGAQWRDTALGAQLFFGSLLLLSVNAKCFFFVN